MAIRTIVNIHQSIEQSAGRKELQFAGRDLNAATPTDTISRAREMNNYECT